MTYWRYIAAVEMVRDEEVWSIREYFEEYGYTEGEIAPVGGSIDDLRWQLNTMLKDLDSGDYLKIKEDGYEIVKVDND